MKYNALNILQQSKLIKLFIETQLNSLEETLKSTLWKVSSRYTVLKNFVHESLSDRVEIETMESSLL